MWSFVLTEEAGAEAVVKRLMNKAGEAKGLRVDTMSYEDLYGGLWRTASENVLTHDGGIHTLPRGRPSLSKMSPQHDLERQQR